MSDIIKNIIWYVLLGGIAAVFIGTTAIGLWNLRPQPVSNPALLKLSVYDAAQGIRNGTVDVATYLQNVIHRLASKDDLNAFVSKDVFPLTTASLPDIKATTTKPKLLLGVPFSVADNINSNKYPTTAATRGLSVFFPTKNALVVDYLLNAGALLIGKTNMPELNYGYSGAYSVDGSVKNGFNSSYIGGSGAAAAVAARIVPFAVASDFLGQLRTSAAMNGVVGFRPSFGRYPMEGVITLAPTLDSVGLIATSARDISLLDNILTELTPVRDPGMGQIRIATPRNTAYYQGLAPEVAQVVDAALKALQARGVQLVVDDTISSSQFTSMNNGASILSYEAVRNLAAYLTKYNPDASLQGLLSKIHDADVAALLATSAKDEVLATTYVHQLLLRTTLVQAAFDDYFAASDVFAMAIPTIGVSPVLLSSLKAANATSAEYGRNSIITSVAGLPSITLPVGLTKSGLPVSIELVGKFKDDLRLLAVARTLERALPQFVPSDLA